MRSNTDAIALIKSTLKEAKDERASKSSVYFERFLEGRISGMETALFFLGDPDAVKKHNDFIAKIMAKEEGEGA